MSKAFRKIPAENRELNQVQENIEQTFKLILDNEVLDGVLLRDIELISGSNNLIEHKLGRSVEGYFVTRKNGVADVYDSKSSSRALQNYLILNTTANVTVDVWVF